MPMPWQLAQSHRPQRGKSKRPIVEQLPSIAIYHLPIPRDYKTYTAPNISLRYPQLASIRLSYYEAEFHIPSLHRGQPNHIQTFKLKHIKTGFGIRHAFICQCGKPVFKLYFHNRRLACRFCCNARYATQTLDKRDRPILQISRIQSFLDNKPYLRARERLQKRLGEKAMT